MTIKLLCRADILVPWRLLSWNPFHPHQPLPGGSQSPPLYSNYSCIHIACGFSGSKCVLIDFTLQTENRTVWSSMVKPPETMNVDVYPPGSLQESFLLWRKTLQAITVNNVLLQWHIRYLT